MNKKTVSENRRQVILSDKYCEKAEQIAKRVTGDPNRSAGIRIALDAYKEDKK